MNIFSSEPFLKVLNDTYFPTEKLVLQNFNIQNKVWRMPVLQNGKAITRWPFLDFYEQLDIPIQDLPKKHIYIYRACYGRVSAETWIEQNLQLAYKAAPYIDWSTFATWSNFEEHMSADSLQHFPSPEKLKRKLVKNLGPISYLRHDPRPEVLRACLQWKSAQFPSIRKLFEDPQHIAFFQNLIANGLVIVSSLSAGQNLLAINISAVWDNRFYSWISSFNAEYAKYSTGRVLLDFLLKESYQNGDKEYDFLLGNEAYKWTYATHTRLIAEVPGMMPITKTWLKQQLLPYPKTFEKIKSFKSSLPFLFRNHS